MFPRTYPKLPLFNKQVDPAQLTTLVKPKTLKHTHQLIFMYITFQKSGVNVCSSWEPKQLVCRMISAVSCDTEYWSNGCWKTSFKCNNISQYYCFYRIFDQISANILLIPNFWSVVYGKEKANLQFYRINSNFFGKFKEILEINKSELESESRLE